MRSLAYRIGLPVIIYLVFVLFLPSQVLASAEPPRSPDTAQNYTVTLYPLADTFVNQASPQGNYGSVEVLKVSVESGAEAAALLKFSFSSIPAGAQIVSATLSLNAVPLRSPEKASALPFYLKPSIVTSSWSESTVTYNTAPSTSYLGDPSVSVGTSGWKEVSVTEIVRGWVNGGFTNYGLQLSGGYGSSGHRYLESRESGSDPFLTVAYTMRKEFQANRDTYVDKQNASTNFGASTNLEVNLGADPIEAYTLVGFDTSSTPAGVEVISATLLMYNEVNRADLEQRSPLGGAALYADAIVFDPDWTEMGVTWNNKPGSVYVNDPSTSWVDNGWTVFNVTNIVRQWLEEDMENDGILLRAEASATVYYHFSSRQGINAPRLIVEYGQEPPPLCIPVTGAAIDGSTVGLIDTEYHFSAGISPPGAGPITASSWTADEQADPVSGDQVDYTWSTPGDKQITFTVEHCGGTTYAFHTITIQEPPAHCLVGIDSLSLEGPLVVQTGVSNQFQAAAGPIDATTPITFSWAADDQTPAVISGSSLASNQNYTWPSAGVKTVRVTADNCGGAVIAHHNVEVVAPAHLPDLSVTSAWYDKTSQRVYAVIENLGETPVPAGYQVDLVVGGVVKVSLTIEDRLLPGELVVEMFSYALACHDQALVHVIADAGGLIAETDEVNNTWSDTWLCDQLPPEIIAGPGVSDIGETAATISFETDERCNSWVEYSLYSYVMPDETDGQSGETEHAIELSGLESNRTYHYQVFCQDSHQNTVNSADLTFQTLPPGSDPPTISDAWIAPWEYEIYEYYTLMAELKNDAAAAWTDRVEFFLDGVLVGAQYNNNLPDGRALAPRYWVAISPYHLGYTRETFFTTHELEVRAYASVSGNFDSFIIEVEPDPVDRPIDMSFFDPPDGTVLYVDGAAAPAGSVLEARVSAAERAWKCTWSNFNEGNVVPPGLEPVNCEGLEQPVATLKLYIDGSLRAIINDPATNQNTLTAYIQNLTLGDHALEFRALASDGATKSIFQTYSVEQGSRDLDLERTVTRVDHYFVISLTVTNIGTLPVIVNHIDDNMTGLQHVKQNDDDQIVSHKQSAWADQSNAVRWNQVRITLKTAGSVGRTLDPGESTTASYITVPIIFEAEYLPTIGDELVAVTTWNGGSTIHYFNLPAGGIYEPNGDEYSIWYSWYQALARTDYVIATNPERLYSHYYGVSEKWQIEDLFALMAELAYLQKGVLGYVHTYDSDTIDDLIEPYNYWWDTIGPRFRVKDEGYVLLVGETEIIPAKYAGTDQFATLISADWVHDTDLWYANTFGETARPELVVGRVIGDHIDRLRQYLNNILAVYNGDPAHQFNRHRAMLVSGRGEGTTDNFVPTINSIAFTLGYFEGWDVSKIHWLDYGAFDDYGLQFHVFTQTLSNQDVVVYRDHGNIDSWHAVVTSDLSALTFSFGDTHPFAFGVACLAGNYERDDDWNLSEEFLYKGAGLYVGATEVSDRETNDDAAKYFFNRWDTYETIGQVINQTKRHVWDGDGGLDHGKMWAFEYNIYGCPKYGRMEEPGARSPDNDENPVIILSRQPEATTFKVVLPDYQVETIEGVDHVSLPGGGVILEPGYPQVPLWTAATSFSAGIRVQDVRLVQQRRGAVETGLNLGYIQPNIDCEGCPPLDPVDPVWWDGWWPPLEPLYDWWVDEDQDGMTTLTIRLFPFHVFSDTYTTLFNNAFTFEVDTVKTGVSIDYWRAGQSTAPRGSNATFHLAMDNTGSPADVVVQTTIKTAAGQIVGGLPLETLESLSGPATLDLAWDTRSYSAGDYIVVVELLNSNGAQLDSAAAEVSLGVYDAQVSALTAIPAALQPGDELDLSMAVENTGTEPFSGTAYLLIQSPGSLTSTALITMPITDLDSGSDLVLPAVWDTTGAELGDYQVLAYAKYMGRTTDPITASITLFQMPVVHFELDPESGIAPLAVAFENQTTGTYDTCLWDFGDGGSSPVCANPVYTYTVGGSYTVTLSVDGPGGLQSSTQTGAVRVYQPCVAAFTAKPTTGYYPLKVAFTFQATGDYSTCAWSFGDGDNANTCSNQKHTYQTAGAFNVSLTVTGHGGANTKTREDYIVVTDPPDEWYIYLPLVRRE